MPSTLTRNILAALLLLAAAIATAAASELPRYALEVRFDLAQSRLLGTATVEVPEGQSAIVHRGNLKITRLESGGASVMPPPPLPQRFSVEAIGDLVIEFEGTFTDSGADFVSEAHINLREIWYPVVLGTHRYALTARLPPDFVAVSEGRRVDPVVTEGDALWRFDLQQPQRAWDGVTLVATRDWITQHAHAGTTPLTVRVRSRNAERLPALIEQTQRHLRELEAQLGPYPYRTLQVVEHPLPVGQSLAMAGYVLLSHASVRADSEEESALRHELTHQWFGNAVLRDFADGNWYEGLATYFGDHHGEEQRGRGWALRQRYLSGFYQNVTDENDLPLARFDRDESQPTYHVGYVKSAMVFHMLRRELGDAVFAAGVRRFVRDNLFSVASWRHIQSAFEAEAGRPLDAFFTQWLRRTRMAELQVKGAAYEANEVGGVMSFTLQQPAPVYAMALPVDVEYTDGEREQLWVSVDRERRAYRLALKRAPARAVIDRSYDVFRTPSSREFPPLFDRLLSRGDLLVVGPPRDALRYGALLDALRAGGARIDWVRPDAYEAALESERTKRSVMFLGQAPAPLLDRLRIPSEPTGFSIEVLRHPGSAGEVMAVVRAASKAQADAAAARILRGRDWSYASFEDGQWLDAGRLTGARGILAWEQNRRSPAPAP